MGVGFGSQELRILLFKDLVVLYDERGEVDSFWVVDEVVI